MVSCLRQKFELISSVLGSGRHSIVWQRRCVENAEKNAIWISPRLQHGGCASSGKNRVWLENGVSSFSNAYILQLWKRQRLLPASSSLLVVLQFIFRKPVGAQLSCCGNNDGLFVWIGESIITVYWERDAAIFFTRAAIPAERVVYVWSACCGVHKNRRYRQATLFPGDVEDICWFHST